MISAVLTAPRLIEFSERTEKQIKDIQDKIEKKKTQIIQTQSTAQAAGPSQVAAQG
jgi:hypothetical protein